MAKTLFEGGASAVLFLDQRQFYPTPEEVAELWSDMFPFSTVMENLQIKDTDDALYKMFENESDFYKQEFTTTTALTIAANGTESSALTIGNQVGLSSTVGSSYLGLVCEIWNSTKTTKRGLVVITTASTTIACKTLKAEAITTVSGDYFIVVGRIRGEGSVALVAPIKNLSVVWNSTAYISDSAEITGDIAAAAKLRGYSDEMAFQRQEMFRRYKNFTEQMLTKSVSTVGTNFDGSGTFSEASLRTIADANSVTGALRTTYGYIPILEDFGVTYDGTGALSEDTNIFKIPGADISYNDYIKYCEIMFDKRDMDEALAFSGRSHITTIAQRVADGDKKFGWAGKMQLGDQQWNKLGFSMRALETNHGVLWFVPTKSLRNAYKNWSLIPNLDHIGIARFRPDEYKNDVKQDDDYDGVKDTMKCSKGLWMRLLKSHHIVQFT